MGADATVITLKGSFEIVSEFFLTAINSILYQRGKLKGGDLTFDLFQSSFLTFDRIFFSIIPETV